MDVIPSILPTILFLFFKKKNTAKVCELGIIRVWQRKSFAAILSRRCITHTHTRTSTHTYEEAPSIPRQRRRPSSETVTESCLFVRRGTWHRKWQPAATLTPKPAATVEAAPNQTHQNYRLTPLHPLPSVILNIFSFHLSDVTIDVTHRENLRSTLWVEI